MIQPVEADLRGWAESRRARSWLYRPRAPDEVAEALEDVARRGLTVVHRGAGLSYGDAALNGGGAVIETTALSRILEIDIERGLVRAQAGATVEDVWRASLSHGWWPSVVPGSMRATVGGCVAMDVHGKNHVQKGSFGEQVASLTLLEPGGSAGPVDAEREPARIDRVIGAQGLTGTILDVTLRLHRVDSGYLEVVSRTGSCLDSTLEVMEGEGRSAAYAVAWIDCAAGGRSSGRSVAHFAWELPWDHPLRGKGLTLAEQALPSRILGVLPRRWAASLLRPLANDPGMTMLNQARHLFARARSGVRYLQSHSAFHFLLDYVPEWKRVYRPHGFLQYQLFLPRDSARYALDEALRLQREAGTFSYLGVLKMHRAGRFAAPYALDGYSLALDFPMQPSRAAALSALCRSFDALLAEVGGRVYAAKDEVSVGVLPRERHGLFSSDLVRRWEGG